jgi:lysophospholipase L1-like esterase
MGGIGSPVITPFEYEAYQISRLLNVEASVPAEGGTGYVSTVAFTTTFGSSAKIAIASAYNPDFIVISGSGNDDGSSGIGAAVASALNDYATACPNVPIIVFGPQPMGATATVSANRQSNNNAVMTNALANSSVIAYIDQIGNATASVSAWSSSTTYTTGNLVSYIGAIWRWDRPTSASNVIPGGTSSNAWTLVSYVFTGTGRQGSTASDGTRDLLLLSDNIHPSKDGATARALKMASEIKSALLTFAVS